MPWMKRLVPFALCLLYFAGAVHSQTAPVTAVRCGRLIAVPGDPLEDIGQSRMR
jgi:hypothetical protein